MAMKDIQKRAGCVEGLQTNRAKLTDLQFWQGLPAELRKESPPQLEWVSTIA